jgi:hypothetical protein
MISSKQVFSTISSIILVGVAIMPSYNLKYKKKMKEAGTNNFNKYQEFVIEINNRIKCRKLYRTGGTGGH